jgi:hypothetical protein
VPKGSCVPNMWCSHNRCDSKLGVREPTELCCQNECASQISGVSQEYVQAKGIVVPVTQCEPNSECFHTIGAN